MNRLGLATLAVAAYALALAVRAPATLVDNALQSFSNGRMRIAVAQGSIWSGSGVLEVLGNSGSAPMSQAIRWDVRPASILMARIDTDIGLGNNDRPIPVSVSAFTLEVGASQIKLPATALALAEPRLKPLDLQGEIQLRTNGLKFRRSGMTGSIDALWESAGSSYSPVSPLGSYLLQLEADGQAMRGQLQTRDGPVRIEGQGAWQMGTKPDFRAEVKVPPEMREQLNPLLRLISVQRDEGTFDLQLR